MYRVLRCIWNIIYSSKPEIQLFWGCQLFFALQQNYTFQHGYTFPGARHRCTKYRNIFTCLQVTPPSRLRNTEGCPFMDLSATPVAIISPGAYFEDKIGVQRVDGNHDVNFCDKCSEQPFSCNSCHEISNSCNLKMRRNQKYRDLQDFAQIKI